MRATSSLPDILTDLQNKTQLTRRSIYRVLVDSGRLDDFKRNPQQFIELAAEVINRSKRLALVDGIKYQRIGAEDYYAQRLFETEELVGYLKSMIEANKSVHEQVIYQSGTERTFSEQLEVNEAIKVYAKLPVGSGCPRPSAPTTPTGPCCGKRTEPSAFTSWSKRRADSSRMIFATKKKRKANAVERTSRLWRCARVRRDTW